ncbi:MAG: PAS domain S-box protein, partial [Dehalococcoidia bacterium]|nr:PAS domain S-box protein [Dehalococcoidia bacterium]
PGRFRLEPFFALCLLFVWVMAVEIGVMLALPQIVALSQFESALADALALLVGVAPAAYLLGFRPIEVRIAERKRLIDGLEMQLLDLSKSVRERSEEIAAVNQSLQGQITEHTQEEKVISQLAAIVESSDDAIIGRNPGGLITVWSAAAERLYGYSAEEAKGRSVSIITPSDRAGELRRISELVMDEERQDHYETVQITKDGRLVDVSVSVFPIIDTDGKLMGSGIIVRDMTERKRFEKAMAVEAREWRATIDGIREGVLVLDEALRVTRCNRAMQEQIGAPFSEILGHPCDEFIGCKAEEGEDPVYIQALHSRHEQSQVFAQGERWMSATAYPLLDMENLVTGVVCVLSDISDRKRAEEALRASEEKFRTLAASAQDAIILVDSHLRISFWNGAAESVFGYVEDEAIGMHLNDLVISGSVPVEGQGQSVDFPDHDMSHGRTRELRGRRKNGTELPAEVSFSMVQTGGNWDGIAIVRDVTPRKMAEEALKEGEKRVRELAVESVRAQEEERQWVADAIHDRIAQDLVAVFQQLQILKPLVRPDHGAQQAVSRALELQQKTIAEARSIMKDLYSPALDTFGLIPLIEEELHRFQEESGCQAVLKVRNGVRFPKHIEGSLYRIFHEGLANIIGHSPQATKVEVCLTSGHDGVTLTLEDDGSGFDVETAMLGKASGGLIGMRRRAEVISGTFDITSETGRGTTVTVHVPAKYVRHPES